MRRERIIEEMCGLVLIERSMIDSKLKPVIHMFQDEGEASMWLEEKYLMNTDRGDLLEMISDEQNIFLSATDKHDYPWEVVKSKKGSSNSAGDSTAPFWLKCPPGSTICFTPHFEVVDHCGEEDDRDFFMDVAMDNDDTAQDHYFWKQEQYYEQIRKEMNGGNDNQST